MTKARINPVLDQFRVPIDSLIINPENVQKHDGKSVAAIAASLNEFGQQKPIVVNSDNIVIAGNGTLEAAIALEWDEIAVVISDLDAEHLQKAYAIADNKTQEYAEWDWPNLANWLADIDTGDLNIEATGFTADEIKEMVDSEGSNEGERQKENGEITCPKCGHMFIIES